MQEINNFSGEYRFLSNFYPARVEYDNVIYPTSEHAFQAAKTLNKAERVLIAGLKTPGQAKRAGRKVEMRTDWLSRRYSVMLAVVWNKFQTSPELTSKLLSTYPNKLVEGNNWHDYYWGVCNGKGENNLGHILMNVRAHLDDLR